LKRQVVIDGKTYEVEYEATGQSPSPSVPVKEFVQSIVLPTPQVPSSGSSGVDESKACRSPIAGIVARVNVEAGQSVPAGFIVVVIEAMKMENNLAAPLAAKVKSVKIRTGDSVKINQILVEYE
jgi:glutaconyl-CoA/methylmalonyl-CoA decarboxylase subunit gamma